MRVRCAGVRADLWRDRDRRHVRRLRRLARKVGRIDAEHRRHALVVDLGRSLRHHLSPPPARVKTRTRDSHINDRSIDRSIDRRRATSAAASTALCAAGFFALRRFGVMPDQRSSSSSSSSSVRWRRARANRSGTRLLAQFLVLLLLALQVDEIVLIHLVPDFGVQLHLSRRAISADTKLPACAKHNKPRPACGGSFESRLRPSPTATLRQRWCR